MSDSKKDRGWADLSFVFDEPEAKVPRITEKRESNVDSMKTFAKPYFGAFRKTENNIKSLSALIDACGPKNICDLSVSKQKQKEIVDWLTRKVRIGKPKVLVISGPSGCGKTAAVKLITNDNNYEVIEWTTPMDSEAYESYVSTGQSDKFLEFLIRATRYNSLLQTKSRRLLLVKDIPNVFLVKPETFVPILENYFQYGKQPLVFVCTDWGSSKALKTLFPSDVKEQFGIDVITVNATTQTAMKNMLKRVAGILNSRGSHMIDVAQHNIDEVLSNSIGDVRSAILNLIFCSLKVTNNSLLKDCGTREESLGLLHGIGRVINPKRIKDGDSWKFVHDPDEIASYFQSQATTFLHFLHENYMKTMDKIEEIDTCADIMSLSDTITYEWRDPNLTRLNLSFCVRGVMVSNSTPVSGWNPVRKPTSEEVKVQRNLGAAEERWYKSIICPKLSKHVPNLDGAEIEQNSD